MNLVLSILLIILEISLLQVMRQLLNMIILWLLFTNVNLKNLIFLKVWEFMVYRLDVEGVENPRLPQTQLSLCRLIRKPSWLLEHLAIVNCWRGWQILLNLIIFTSLCFLLLLHYFATSKRCQPITMQVLRRLFQSFLLQKGHHCLRLFLL